MESIYRQVGGVEVNPVPDGFVLYEPSGNMVHFLNPSAMMVWELCTGARKAKDIAAIVRELYGLDQIPGDMVRQTLADMASKGLVVSCPA
jgi:hypothetical protein